MPGCVAVGCSNSDTKGFIMRVFPRDPIRRKEWANKVSRENWFPSNTSYLCEIHFDENQWENRLDGKLKLKPNAVPSLFVSELSENAGKSCKSKKQPAIEMKTIKENEFVQEVLRNTKPFHEGEKNDTSTEVLSNKLSQTKSTLRKRHIVSDDETSVPVKCYKINSLNNLTDLISQNKLTLKNSQTVKTIHECENCIILEELLKCASNTVTELKNTIKQYDQSLLNIRSNFEKISRSKKRRNAIKKPKIEHAYSRREF